MSQIWDGPQNRFMSLLLNCHINKSPLPKLPDFNPSASNRTV